MKKKTIFISLLAALILIVIYLYNGHPLVFNKTQEDVVSVKDDSSNQFNPLNNIDLSSGNNVAYLVFSDQDKKELPQAMPAYSVLECSDNTVLKEMQNSFVFNRTNSDMATCESKLLIYKNNKLIFNSAFVVSDNSIGMQNSIVGWAEPANNDKLKKVLMQFKPAKRLYVKL